LVQVTAVTAALRALGHECTVHPVTGDLGALNAHLAEDPPELVFNLVESLEGSDASAVAVPALLDGLGIAYTGSRAAAVAVSNDKCTAKRLLDRLGLPTPEWLDERDDGRFCAGRYILKARFEHASKGLEEGAIKRFANIDAAREAVAAQSANCGRPCFAERFIDGREFNLSILEGADGPQVLPPAEIDFSAFPAGKPRLVGYRAKWVEDSFEFNNTPRQFDFPDHDQPLLARLRDLACSAFESFDLRGYARIDFRVDDQGPWILEMNTNPCISPNAGFTAALDRAGISYAAAIGRILQAARRRES
jgi:D-alanine-D-alanine ligase